MQHDRLYLIDMLRAADAIPRFLAGHTLESFVDDDMCSTAVLKKLEIMGEAARPLSDELKDRYPHVPWQQMRSFRNLAVHHYFSIDWAEVWRTATTNIPVDRVSIGAILAAEFPEDAL